MKKTGTMIATLFLAGAFLAGCSTNKTETTASSEKTEASSSKEEASSLVESEGEKRMAILASTNWQGSKVLDENQNDVTEENKEFIGLAKYDAETGFYEFFDKETGETRGDEGTFFVTADGTKRILISATKNYQAVVELTELNAKMFTYKRTGKDKDGKEATVYVEHIPYAKELTFTSGRGALETKTGTIEKGQAGREILGATLWNGTKVLDEDGQDVTEANKMFISLAKFSAETNQYEFFDKETGKTRGDFGYFDVLASNKLRAHVSLGENKYGAALELTEINAKKFTYKRMGKDKDGKDVTVYVEHVPYTGEYDPDFTA